MKNQFQYRKNQSFRAKVFAGFALFFAITIILSSLTFAEEQKKEEKSGCPYMKAVSGCCSAEKTCADSKDAKNEWKSKKDSKSGTSACGNKSQPSADGKSCEKKNMSSNTQCSDCKCCSACNCTGHKETKTACNCGDKCKCCASCCLNKA
ncbi:MAG: hypothetical protein ACP5UA_02820 [Candidatus Hydrogenedens sp.]